jgi:hypothetical protein
VSRRMQVTSQAPSRSTACRCWRWGVDRVDCGLCPSRLTVACAALV